MTASTIAIPRARRPRATAGCRWGSPAIYFVALVVVGLMLGAGRSTSSSAASAPTRRSRPTRRACPTRGRSQNYADVLGSPTLLGRGGATPRSPRSPRPSASSRSASWPASCSRATSSGARGLLYALFAAGLMFPMTVAITPLYIVVRNLGLMNSLAGIILPADRLRPADDDHHPRAVPARHPRRARGGRVDRRMPAASASSGAWWCRWRCPASSPSASSRSSRAGTATCCRCSS